MTAVLDPPDAGTEETEDAGKPKLGRVLDVAGVVAGVVLGVILFDVMSGGKLTRWAQRKRGGPEAGGCADCGDGPSGDS